jgi:magnesium transporter
MVRELNAIMTKAGLESVRRHLRYPAETVGALMRGRYATLDESWTAAVALESVRHGTRLRRLEETYLDTLMVADADGRLRGVVGLKALVIAPGGMLVGELMDGAPRTLRPAMDQEAAVNLFTKYRLKSAPVVDDGGRLLGVVVDRDILAVTCLIGRFEQTKSLVRALARRLRLTR